MYCSVFSVIHRMNGVYSVLVCRVDLVWRVEPVWCVDLVWCAELCTVMWCGVS